MKNRSEHKFHIPVMGLAYTIDTPIKVAKFGIDSVVSIMDDHLIEQMREVICRDNRMGYTPIATNEFDYRAKRITAYLNLMQDVIDRQIDELKAEGNDNNQNLKKYFEMLPESSIAKKLFLQLPECSSEERILLNKKLRPYIVAGNIDVNIMTKLDKTNYDKSGQELPVEFADAHAALRGYANSRLKSSIIFSAGLNPRLTSYCENFEDFYPDEQGVIKKKIVLKVSDYRSALIQGKYFVKKGLWVSEFRVESGINCGGHAFISNGVPLGPILEEFKLKRNELYSELLNEYDIALTKKDKKNSTAIPEMRLTAQGGIGTSEENNFLLNYYNLDATGWGSPFLLVPEATSVDDETLSQLVMAKKEDYFLSNASPLGVPFNNFRKSSSEYQRLSRIDKQKPGSPCYKKFLSMSTEFTKQPICTASRQYQKLKIEILKTSIIDQDLLKYETEKVTDKDCLCSGLGAAALIKNKTKVAHNLKAVNICPGPNLAYFSNTFSLRQIVDHIYGRANILNQVIRPNLFVNELQLYVDYLKKELGNKFTALTDKKVTFFQSFKTNLLKGIEYYETTLPKLRLDDSSNKSQVLNQLSQLKETLNCIKELQLS